MQPEVVVLSTGFKTPAAIAERCKASVRRQSIDALHIYIDAAKYGGTAAENRFDIINKLDPATIVAEVDCDDYLACYDAIAKVVYAHTMGAWLTYGQFVYDDYSPGWARPWPKGANPRDVSWFATHLKTYRAGLFQQIKESDLRKPDGSWCEHAIDNLLMMPMLEMAGPDRSHYVSDVLYVYSGRGTDVASMAEAVRIRAKPPYPRLEQRPW
jgi:hypothetical protein